MCAHALDMHATNLSLIGRTRRLLCLRQVLRKSSDEKQMRPVQRACLAVVPVRRGCLPLLRDFYHACGTPSRLLAGLVGACLVGARCPPLRPVLPHAGGPEAGYSAPSAPFVTARARSSPKPSDEASRSAKASMRRYLPRTPRICSLAGRAARTCSTPGPRLGAGWSRPRTGNSCSPRRCASRSAGGRSILAARACWLPPLSSSRASTCSRGPDRVRVRARARRACSHSFRTHWRCCAASTSAGWRTSWPRCASLWPSLPRCTLS